MCGIAGLVLAPGAGPLPRAPEAVALAMAQRMEHRGPDGFGAWASPSGRCTLGHARLAVIDPDGGHQPMASENGGVRVVFNGEIYNHVELRRELAAAGHRFASRCDTEVLVHGWEEWGDALPERLEGMFAFAVWDEARGELFMARDRTGQKPLFVAPGPALTAFASELKAFAAVPGLVLEVAPAGIARHLSHGYQPGEATPYAGVVKLRPGHRARLRPGGAWRPERWWSVAWHSGGMPRRRALEELPGLLDAAVRRRLEADVPLGAYLSGGVDSSLVVALMARDLDSPVRTFSLGFADDPGYDETSWAEAVARRWGTRHTAFTVEADTLDLLDDLVRHWDEPFGDSSALPSYIIADLTRRHVTVALTGDGGDELFAGYPRFRAARWAARLPGPLAGAGRAAAGRLPYPSDFRHPLRRLRQFLEAADLPEVERTLTWIGHPPGRVAGLLRPEHHAAAGVVGPGDAGRALDYARSVVASCSGATPLSRQLALNFATYLPDDLLVKVDRASMAHGLELRSPFLDTALVEWAAGLPDGVRIHRGRLKAILVDALGDLLPPGVAERPKMGFGVPLALWFRTRWRARFEDEVLAPDAAVSAWLRPEAIRELWRAHRSGSRDHGHALWSLLTLERWLRIGPHVA